MSAKTPTILKLDENTIETGKLQIAADFIRQGKLVVFPTDTSYGLGANITDLLAVKKIFQLKNRPLDQPIHIVVSSLKMGKDYAYLTNSALKLAHIFCQGL